MSRSLPLSVLVAGTLIMAPLLVAQAPARAAESVPPAALPEKASCAVCAAREGKGPEAVRASTLYEGKTYYFCSDRCRDEFLKNPHEFTGANTPRPAPGFSLKDLKGQSVNLGAYKGRVVLLDFWATWCAPCVASMPDLQKLHARYAPKGFAVIGIAIDEKGAEIVAPVVAKKKVKYPILLGTEATWTAYGVRSLPALFLVDREGQIVRQFGGATSQEVLEKAVRGLLEGGAAAGASSPEVPEKAVCAVCGVREKSGPEPVAATYVFQGKTYYFCKPSCKEEFQRDPEKWIKAAAAAPPSRRVAQAPPSGASAVPT